FKAHTHEAALLQDADRCDVPFGRCRRYLLDAFLHERPLDAGARCLCRDSLTLPAVFDAIADLGDAIVRTAVEDDASDDEPLARVRDHQAIAPESFRRIGADGVERGAERA